MKLTTRCCLSALLIAFSCALIPAGRLWAQQTSGAPASPQAAAAIDQLTAPIALYPDALIYQILDASMNAAALQSFADWMKKNDKLKGSELQDAAQKAGFAPAFVALAPFPQVIQMMVQKPDWTKQLGQAFTTDNNAVFDSIQRMRTKAQSAGNLKSTPQQVVETKTTAEGQQVIVIESANPQVVYVPTYNPQTVYVAAPPSPSGASVAGAAAIGFTMGVIIGGAHNSYWHRYDDYWDHREDFYNDRQEHYQNNAENRQNAAKENQGQRQSEAQERQGQRQSAIDSGQSQASANQASRQSSASAKQSQASAGQASRQPSTSSMQSQTRGGEAQRSSAAATSSRGGGQTASQRSGMSSGGFSGYQSGSATRAQSSRGSRSVSSSRGSRSGGGRSR